MKSCEAESKSMYKKATGHISLIGLFSDEYETQPQCCLHELVNSENGPNRYTTKNVDQCHAEDLPYAE